jgi:hypothetical protein
MEPSLLLKNAEYAMPGGSEQRMQSMNETPQEHQPDSTGAEILVAEVAEAHAVAQRAAAPDAGQQDWLAAEEVAMVHGPEQDAAARRPRPWWRRFMRS